MDERIIMAHTIDQLVISQLGVYISIPNPETITLADAHKHVDNLTQRFSRDSIGATVKELIARPTSKELYIVFDTYTTLSADRQLSSDKEAIDKAEAAIRTILDQAIDDQTITDYTVYASNISIPQM